MKAIVMQKVAPLEQVPLEYRDTDEPTIGEGEVLVRVKACGVCHSNLHMIEGDLRKWGIPAALPIIPGHEIVGVVEARGSNAGDVEVGQRVGVSVIWQTCGGCEFCSSGDENLCPSRKITGETVNGGYAQYLKAPKDFVYPMYNKMSDVEAATLFCPGVTSFRAVQRSNIARGENVMIIGIGGVGQFSVQFAKMKGARVAAVDVSDKQLALASEMGADDLVLSENADTFARSFRPTKVIVHTPAQRALDLATRVIKSRGTIMMAVFGSVPVGFGGEVTIATSMAGSRKDIDALLRLVADEKVKVKASGSPLSQGIEVLNRMKGGQIVGRAVLVPP